jgi:aspartate racemase
MTSVGIVGGLGVGATVHYYEKITAACKARGVVPDLVIVHADVDYGQGLVRAGKLDELADYLASFVERLGRAGAETAVLPAVTPHIAIAQLKRRTRLPILNIVDPIAAELKARKIARVALYGTIFTMQGSLWGQLTGVEIVKPQPQEMDFIGTAYQRILDTEKADSVDTGELRRIAAELQRRDGVQAILLAGTDLALMFDEASAGFPAIDVARLHIEAIVERLADKS